MKKNKKPLHDLTGLMVLYLVSFVLVMIGIVALVDISELSK